MLISLVAFGSEKGLLKNTCLFFISSAALGGAVFAVGYFGSGGTEYGQGGLYERLDTRVVFIIILLSYGIISVVTDRIFSHAGVELVPVEIVARGKKLQLTALVDTGNTLTELGNNRPVLIAEGEVCRALLSPDIQVEKPIEALRILNENNVKGFSLLPYRAVGVPHGLLLAMRAEEIRLGKKTVKNMLVALSPTPVSDGGGYHALIGGEIWK
jgi:stage II sporulation protein GA (sporulation sigma-E factor processing peptidase)